MKFAVIHIDTTGPLSKGKMAYIAIVKVDEKGDILSYYQSHIGENTCSFAPGSTNISEDNPQKKDIVVRSLEQVAMECVPLLEDVALVGYDVYSQVSFLQQALDQCGYHVFTGPVIDVIPLLQMLFPSLLCSHLDEIAAQVDQRQRSPDQGDDEALTVARLFRNGLQKLETLPFVALERLIGLLESEYPSLSLLLQQTLQIRQKANVHQLQDSHTHRHFALHVADWTDEVAPREHLNTNPLAEVEFESYINDVIFAMRKTLPQYEEREAQISMCHRVNEALEKNKHLLIEAGTGTGKSLAYLIPSLYYSVKHDQKVMVSTYTVNLQDQLRQRDIPLLHKTIPVPFKISLFKGRGHYLCLRKFEYTINTSSFGNTKEETLLVAKIIIWLTETNTGDKQELTLVGDKEKFFWEKVKSDPDSCLGRACPWFRKCYYHRAKHEATLSDIVITNHSKLFTQVKSDRQLLPPYHHLVIDEAHHFEAIAGKHLGIHIKSFSFEYLFTRLCKDNRSGQLFHLRHHVEKTEHEQSMQWKAILDELYSNIVEAKHHWDELYHCFFYVFSQHGYTDGQRLKKNTLRFQKTKKMEGWDSIVLVEKQLHTLFEIIVRKGEQVISDIQKKSVEMDQSGIIADISTLLKHIDQLGKDVHFFVENGQENIVYWMEAVYEWGSKSVQLYAAPIDVTSQLRDLFFNKKNSVILTSATLSVNGSFQFSIEQLGLQQAAQSQKLITMILPSPFHYKEQALVIIPRNFPTVRGDKKESPFVDALIQSLIEIATAMNGRTLVLFTSYTMLHQVYIPLKQKLMTKNVTVLGQGIDTGSSTKLLHLFQRAKAAVLLGTNSFWEGIDIPGTALTCLAIVKLPFQPPTHPYTQAKTDWLKQHHKNPFNDFAVPQAVLRFKQGFGRLVRTGKDRGIAIVYDTRVIHSAYGKCFLHSLPGPKIEHMSIQQVVPRMQQWMKQ